jgi:hypothetical protein
MDTHFMTRRCAIKHLMEVRLEVATNPNSRVIVNTHLGKGVGADRIERVLLDVRAARVSYFVQHGSTVGDRIFLIS